MDGTGRLFAGLLRELPPELGARAMALREGTYDALVEAVAVPPGPFAIVAESFSGPLGVMLAERHRERVRALVLVASFVRSPSTLLRWMQPSVNALARIPLPTLALRAGLLGLTASEAEVNALREALASVSPERLAERLHAVALVDVTHAFIAGRVPVLYLAGRHDRLVGTEVWQELKRLRPDLEVAVLDAPHLVLQQAPVEASRLISEFISRNRPAGAASSTSGR